MMTTYKTYRPRGEIDKLYGSRKVGERGLASIGYYGEASIQWLKEKIEWAKKEYLQLPVTAMKT